MTAHVDPTTIALPDERQSNGCFETMRVYYGKIFRLDAHLERLGNSARTVGVSMPARRVLRQRLLSALHTAGLQDGVVRVALFPNASGGVTPGIVVGPAQLPSAEEYRRGIQVATVPTRKSPIGAINNQAKYSARTASVLAIVEAQLRGATEALWMDDLGLVTESTASNFAIVRQGVLVTSPCSLGLLAGITRDVLFELAKTLRLPVREIPLTRHDIYNASEAMLLSTIKEMLPVTRVDGRVIGSGTPGPVTRRLQRAFRQLIKRELHDRR